MILLSRQGPQLCQDCAADIAATPPHILVDQGNQNPHMLRSGRNDRSIGLPLAQAGAQAGRDICNQFIAKRAGLTFDIVADREDFLKDLARILNPFDSMRKLFELRLDGSPPRSGARRSGTRWYESRGDPPAEW